MSTYHTGGVLGWIWWAETGLQQLHDEGGKVALFILGDDLPLKK
jgi:hypothetical protein